MSEEQKPKHVYQAIVAIQKELAETGITKKKDQQNFKTRGIDDAFNAFGPLLAKHNLCIFPRILSRTEKEKNAKLGGILTFVVVDIEIDLVSSVDGSSRTVKTYGEAMDVSDKATSKAMSIGYKNALFLTFCVPVTPAPDTTYEHGNEPASFDAEREQLAKCSSMGELTTLFKKISLPARNALKGEFTAKKLSLGDGSQTQEKAGV